MKAILGIMHGLSAQILLLRDIMKDGASFWSYYGAVPAKEPEALANEIQKALENSDVKLNQDDRGIFEAARQIAESCPYHGWRALSQADELSAEGKMIRHKIFDGFCQRKVNGLLIREAMVIFPAEESTREILGKRLGALPIFQRVVDIHPLEELLSQSPVIPTRGISPSSCSASVQQCG